MRQIILRISLIVAVVAVLLTAGGLMWLRSTLPKTSGDVAVTGTDAAVVISRTTYGLPTIAADSLHDAWFGLGFVHAQDRLWQMESLRRFALGRLSEVIGPATLDIDVQQRRLGFGRLAQAQYAALDAPTRAALGAYAAGVNAFLTDHGGALPPEFTLLGFTPEPWQPYHGLLWGRLMAYQLSARWRDDVAREALFGRLGGQRMRALWPDIGDGPQAAVVPTDLPASPFPPPRGASNAWAVAPERSLSGGALLAGDPHLGLQVPGIWYLARLVAEGRVIEGATAPGVPFVVIGRNRDVAWSFTSNEADLQDVAHVSQTDITAEWDEIVHIKGAEAQSVHLLESKGAPLIAGKLLNGRGDDGLALLATALAPTDATPSALLGLNMASGVDDALRALDGFQAPLMNVIMADTGGHIVRTLAGALPVRGAPSGRLPLARGAPRWTVAPAHTMVEARRDPAPGIVANANERTAEIAKLDHVSGDWPDGARASRLKTLLGAARSFSADDLAEMQNDAVDASAAAWNDVLAAVTLNGAAAEARALLLDWDGGMRRDTAAPLIYAAWMAELSRLLFADELREAYPTLMLPGPLGIRRLLEAESVWCDDIATQPVETCAGLPVRAFDAAIQALGAAYGDAPAAWRWGFAHLARFDNALLGRLPLIGSVFQRFIQADGGDRTLNRGASHRGAGTDTQVAFPDVHGPGFRAVHDLSGVPSLYMTVPGQSGNPMSAHYADLLERWRDGVYVDFAAPVLQVLTLTPRPRG